MKLMYHNALANENSAKKKKLGKTKCGWQRWESSYFS